MTDRKESLEDYLEKILMLKKKQDIVRAIDLASFMSFSKASVSVALKKMKEMSLVEVDPDNGNITLTKEGEEIAKHVYERHEVLSYIFISLGVDEAIARADACRIEHDISDETFEVLKSHYYNKNN